MTSHRCNRHRGPTWKALYIAHMSESEALLNEVIDTVEAIATYRLGRIEIVPGHLTEDPDVHLVTVTGPRHEMSEFVESMGECGFEAAIVR